MYSKPLPNLTNLIYIFGYILILIQDTYTLLRIFKHFWVFNNTKPINQSQEPHMSIVYSIRIFNETVISNNV